MSNAQSITDDTFEAEVLQSDKPVLVDFWANWCAPCKMIAPFLDEIADEMGEKVKIVKMDIDANQNVPRKYNIMSIPSLLIFKGGEVVDQIVGAKPKVQISERLEKAIS
ncbi:MAG: thioredoxin [candidate division Zixibacteria bacterium]